MLAKIFGVCVALLIIFVVVPPFAIGSYMVEFCSLHILRAK